MHVAPIEHDFGGGRLVDRPNQPAVGGSQTHQVAQPVFHAIQVGERLFDLAAELVVLIAGLGFLVGLAPFGLGDIQGIDLPPGLQRAVAADFRRVEGSIGVIKFPIGVFNVADQVRQVGLEIGQADVVVEPGDHHAVEAAADAGSAGVERTVDLIEQRAAAAQQPLGEAQVDAERIVVRQFEALAIAIGVDGRGGDADGAARLGPLGDAGIGRVHIFQAELVRTAG